MPDIDMDFDSRYRGEMIKYVVAALRRGPRRPDRHLLDDQGAGRGARPARVLDYPYGLGDKIAKLMPPLIMGRDTPLHACFEQNPKFEDGYKMAADLREFYESDPDGKRVIDVAKGPSATRRAKLASSARACWLAYSTMSIAGSTACCRARAGRRGPGNCLV